MSAEKRTLDYSGLLNYVLLTTMGGNAEKYSLDLKWAAEVFPLDCTRLDIRLTRLIVSVSRYGIVISCYTP